MGRKKADPQPEPSPQPAQVLVVRDEKGRVVSGSLNPSGVSQWVRDARAKLEEGSVEAVAFCLSVMRGAEKDSIVSPTGDVVETPPRLRERVKAAELLIAYGVPKPKPAEEDGTSEQSPAAQLAAAIISRLSANDAGKP